VNISETARIIAYVDARLGRNKEKNPLQAEAWHEDLETITYADAHRAARYLTVQPGVIEVKIGDLVAQIRKMRREILERIPDPLPDADPNDVVAWVAALRESRRRLVNLSADELEALIPAIEAGTADRFMAEARARGLNLTPKEITA
jgi:hypothetical protein